MIANGLYVNRCTELRLRRSRAGHHLTPCRIPLRFPEALPVSSRSRLFPGAALLSNRRNSPFLLPAMHPTVYSTQKRRALSWLLQWIRERTRESGTCSQGEERSGMQLPKTSLLGFLGPVGSFAFARRKRRCPAGDSNPHGPWQAGGECLD